MRTTTFIAIFLSLFFLGFSTNSWAGGIPTPTPEPGCRLNGNLVPDDPPLIEGTKGDDYIDCRTSDKSHSIYGYGGIDTIYGSEYHSNFIAGGSGGDKLHGGHYDDAIDGGGGDDYIWGYGGNDILFGGVGSSPASGVGCTLQLAAAGSSHLTKGGSGDDHIYGGDGDDCIDAGSGEDFVYGGNGNDTIEGGNHNDWLDGGEGADHIYGDWHTDTCIGCDCNDIFTGCEVIVEPSNNYDCDNECGDPPECGDGIIEQGEECEGGVGDATCDDFGCSGGELSCSVSCTIDTSSCTDCMCNNDGVCQSGEDCNSCSNDCSEKNYGKPSGRYCCGDDIPHDAQICL